MKLEWACITMELKENSIVHFRKLTDWIMETTRCILKAKDVKFTEIPRITIDNLWDSSTEEVVDKVQWIENSIGNDFETIRVGRFKSIDFPDFRTTLYLEVTWWKQFFDSLKNNGFSLIFPHITVAKITHDFTYDEADIYDILQKLNDNPELARCREKLLIDYEKMYVRNKENTRLQLIDLSNTCFKF